MRTLVSTLCLLGLLCGDALAAPEPVTLKLWPQGPPSAMVPKSEATVKAMQSYGGITATRLSDITDPTITVYRPEKPNGASVIVAPGGAYTFLSASFEGTQVCEWLTTIGVTGVLLKYRTPTRDEKDPSVLPVQDAQRAIGLVRHHAAEWKLDPQRVGLLGFSAGGNLAGHVAWDRGARTYAPVAELDDPRGPDFLVFIYGGGFLDRRDRSKFREGFSVPADAPPAFFLVAHDDGNNPVEAAMLYLEYKKLKLPAELHICTKGGHGFGMRRNGQPINDWPQRCAEWMNSIGLLGENPHAQGK
jgi:dienelactone hydrolase